MSVACHIDKVNYALSADLIGREMSETSFFPFPSLTVVKMKRMWSLLLLKVACVLQWNPLVQLAALLFRVCGKYKTAAVEKNSLQNTEGPFVRLKLERSLQSIMINYWHDFLVNCSTSPTSVFLFLNSRTILLFKHILHRLVMSVKNKEEEPQMRDLFSTHEANCSP